MSTTSWYQSVLGVGGCLLGLILLGCGSSPGEQGGSGESLPRDRRLFPLEAGRTWTFERPGVGGRITMIAEPVGAARAARLRIVGGEEATYARLGWRGPELRMSQPGRSEVLLLRLPARPGMTWTAADGVRAKMLEDVEVRVPAGRFRCAVVRLDGGPVRETYWVASGVGFVRVLREGPGGREEAVLAGFTAGT